MKSKEHYAKELEVENERKTIEFIKEVNRISEETKTLNYKKNEAKEHIEVLKKEMSNNTINIEDIMNEKERKKVVAKKRELQEKIDELELFSLMDVSAYRKRKLNEIYELGKQAKDEYYAYASKVDDMVDALRNETKEKEQELFTKRRIHPFLSYEKIYDDMDSYNKQK